MNCDNRFEIIFRILLYMHMENRDYDLILYNMNVTFYIISSHTEFRYSLIFELCILFCKKISHKSNSQVFNVLNYNRR